MSNPVPSSSEPAVKPASPQRARTAPVATVQDPAVAAFQLLLRHERESRQPANIAELGFFIANEVKKLVGGRQVFLATFAAPAKFRLVTISSLSGVDRDAPIAQAIERLLSRFGRDAGTAKLQNFSASAYTEPGDGPLTNYPFPELVWVPLKQRDGTVFAGLLLAREQAWGEQDCVLLSRLAETYAHAWQALIPRGSLRAVRFRPASRTTVIAALVAAGVLAFVPVPMSALAPAEVVATDAYVIAAPIDGVIDEIAVDPSSSVAEGAILFRFTDTVFRNNLEIAEREVLVAEAKWQQVSQQAISDPLPRRELAITTAELALKRTERDFARDVLSKTVVRAPRAGVAVFADKREFVGRPLSVGQRVMDIADPAKVQIRVNVAVEDAVVMSPGAHARIFLDSDPLHPLAGSIERASHTARVVDGSQLAFRIDVRLVAVDMAPPRLGIRGTAQLIGSNVPLYLYLLRKPISYLRQKFGL